MDRSILTPAFRARGALLSGSDPPEVLAFGDAPDEYARVSRGAGLFDQTDRGLAVATGADAVSFLHRMLANEVRKLAPGEGNRNLLLSGKGKVLFDFDLAVEPDGIRMSTPRGQGKPLADALEAYHFSEKVTLADRTQEHAPIALAGPEALAIAARVLEGFTPPAADHATVRPHWDGKEVRATVLAVHGSSGLRVDGGPELAPRLWEAFERAGAAPCGRIVADSLRVEACAAEPLIDIDENIYPQEARLESAFSLDKGCYVGQEVIAKIDTYGGLNKRLVALRVSSDDPVARGTRLFREDAGEWRDLGVVTSWAYSFALDAGLALAYVKRRHQGVGTTFRLGDGPVTATVVAVPVRAHALPVSGEFEAPLRA